MACPLGPRVVLGVVLGRDPATHEGRLAPLRGVLDAPAVPPHLLDLALWTARHYLAPLNACLRLVLPPGADGALRRDADGGWRLRSVAAFGAAPRLVARTGTGTATGRRAEVLGVLAAGGGSLPAAELVRRAGTTMPTLRAMAEAGLIGLGRETTERSGLDWAGAAPPPDRAPPLGPAQAEALAELERMLGEGHGGEVLLHGVTGSGKTEVYLRAIAAARALGRTSLVLAPEIALTPQLLGRLRARLGEGVSIWHSGLSPAQRAAEDRRIRDGRADVVLGARSAVYAPLSRLGLVIVDEEHDPSYKQDATPRYDARAVAFRRARSEGALVLYGSATPRPEAWRALRRMSLPERADGAPLPPVEVVDMRTQGAGPISRPLAGALHEAADAGAKAILLLNRRGVARVALCRSCGWIARCPRCDVPLVTHRGPEGPLALACHHCGHEGSIPTVCPRCRSTDVARRGSGTAGVERVLAGLLPDVPLIRLDSETAAARGALTDLLARFLRPGPAVLLGTQMVAKGHDLPHVAVAAVLEADGPLQRADFRAEERAFSLIVQLAGRAGRRRGEASRVIVQAMEPEARAIRLGARHAVAEFLDGELRRREPRGFPPFGHLVRVVLDGPDERAVGAAAAEFARNPALTGDHVRVLGPAPLHRLRDRSRRSLLVRADRSATAAQAVARALQAAAGPLRAAGLRVAVDVDPQDT